MTAALTWMLEDAAECNARQRNEPRRSDMLIEDDGHVDHLIVIDHRASHTCEGCGGYIPAGKPHHLRGCTDPVCSPACAADIHRWLPVGAIWLTILREPGEMAQYESWLAATNWLSEDVLGKFKPLDVSFRPFRRKIETVRRSFPQAPAENPNHWIIFFAHVRKTPRRSFWPFVVK